MSNLTINRIGPEAQADSAWHDEDVEAARFAALDVRPAPARWRGRDALGVALAGLVALGGWLALVIVFWVAARITESAYPPAPGWVLFWQVLLGITASAPAWLGILAASVWVYERRIYARRANVIRDKLMNPVPAHLINQLTLPSYYALFERAAALEREVAPYRAYRGVESLSLSASAAKPSGEEARKALESVVTPAIERLDDWVTDVAAREAHILVSGKTASGKTTTGAALLARRIDAGDAICVIDPHHEPGKWWGIDAIGAGRDYAAIGAALDALDAEMTERYRRLADGEPPGQRLTVLIDEAPAIAAALERRWKAVATRLGSEARKVGIALIILSQSPLVEDLMMNSVMRRNYTIIGLDMASIRVMLRDARNARDILATLEGRPYPALREVDGEFRICDRTGIHQVRPQRSPNVWRLPVCDEAASGPAQTDRRADAETIERLKAFIRAGITRDEARAQGVAFDNSDWTRARREVEAETELLNGLLVASPRDGLRATTEVQG